MTANNEIPAPIGSIEFERYLYKDSLGATWRGLDRSNGAKVDLRLLPEWVQVEDMRQWVARISAVTHRGLIRTLALATADGRAAVVMEFMDGETLFQRRARRPRRFFEVSEIKPWLKALAETLGHLHQQGIAHGALHGGNVFVEGAMLKLGDLAVSRLIRPTAGESRLLPLPPPAMSPQVQAGELPTEADDVYALGALVYDLLTGKPVFFSGDVSAQVQSVVPPSVAERRRQLDIESAAVPEPWEKWIAGCLAKDATKRPVLADLLAMLGAAPAAEAAAPGVVSSGVAARAVPVTAAKGPRREWHTLLTVNQWIIAAAAVLVVGLGTLIYTQRIAPKLDFKQQLDGAFLTATQFDADNLRDHDAVIEKWDGMIKSWQPRVTMTYPEFDAIMANARAQRQARLDQKQADEKTALTEVAARLEARLKKARADFEIIQFDAITRTGERGKLLEEWTQFLKRHDVDFEGRPLAESFGKEIAEAKKQSAELSQAIADENALIETQTTKTDGELAKLRQLASDSSQPAAGKIAQTEALLDQIAHQPRVVLKTARFDELRQSAESLLVDLKGQAEKETPKEPLDLQNLFAASVCKEYSEPGRKRMLLVVQTALKDQSFYSGTPDGGPGKTTHDAILAFQKAKNLVPSAALDDPTLTALGLAEIKDDATPMPAAKTHRSSSSRKPPEEKSVARKTVDGVKNVGKSIGNFFTGKSDKKK